MENKQNIRCVVACTNSNGEPDLFSVKVQCDEADIDTGSHYDAARKHCDKQGNKSSEIVFDERDSAGDAIMHVLNGKRLQPLTLRGTKSNRR